MSNQSQPRRIAILSDAIYPYNLGGKETRIHELSTRLAAMGHEVTIYTMKWWDGPELTRRENGVNLEAISRLYPLYHHERRSISQGIWFGLACLKLITKSFDVLDVDHMPYFPLFSAKIVAILRRKPMVATWHEVWGVRYWTRYLGPLGLIAAAIERLSVVLPTRIVAVSALTASQIKRDLHRTRRTLLVPNGLDLAAIDHAPTSRTPSDILYAGRLLEHKHVDLLIRAVGELAQSTPEIRCVILGDGPDRPRLELLTAELGLRRQVKFKGFLAKEASVYGYMKASKVFVSPSSREGFGMSVLEATACGLPVVTVDVPSNAARELITPANGRLAELSAASLADNIGRLLATPPNAAAVRATATSYDWQQAAKAMSKVYAS